MAKKLPTHAFHPCQIMTLNDEQIVEAARAATAENPMNRPVFEPMMALATGPLKAAVSAIVEQPLAIAVLTTKYWGKQGVNLTITSREKKLPDLMRKITEYANRWGRYANVTFRWIDTANWQEGDVRISFGGGGYWSYLGTDIKQIPRNEQTMNLQGFSLNTSNAEFDRVVVHEFGHTLGFPHEHMRSAIVQQLDERKTITYFRSTQGWSESEVRAQVLTPLSEASIMATPADEDSIMCYQLPASITKDGQPILGGPIANENDLQFCAKIYPKDVSPPPPAGKKRLVIIVESDSEMTIVPDRNTII